MLAPPTAHMKLEILLQIGVLDPPDDAITLCSTFIA